MAILTKEVEVRVNPRTIKYYESLGYKIPMKRASKITHEVSGKELVYDFSKSIIIKIEDLPMGSDAKIEVLCDMCHENKMLVSYGTYNRVTKKTGSYVCKDCINKKRVQTMLKKYNVENALHSEVFKDKMRQTNIERYGVESYTQTKEYNEKVKETCLKKYNVEHISKLEEVKKKKALTSYKYSSKECSRQQFYIYNLYNINNNAELNYPVKSYNLDICFPNEKLDVEIDFGGHNLSVKIGKLTQEEFDQREIIRNNIIKREGYKQMRIISRKDLLPSDDTLLQMLSMAREYFNTTSHTWVNFDIDNSIMINAENKDTNGVFFDYGELRKIKEIA